MDKAINWIRTLKDFEEKRPEIQNVLERLGYDDLAALKANTPDSTWTERRKRFYDSVERAAAESIEIAAHAGGSLTEAHKLKLKVDAFLDGLIISFEAGELSS